MSQRTFGYARVSTTDQNLDRQIAQLSKYVADERDIYTDKASGKNFDRAAYNALVGTATTRPILRDGDLIVICSLDRLGRNYIEIREQWENITNTLKADIKVLDMPLLDTSVTPDSLDRRFIADLVLQILSYNAQKERESIRKRQREGIDVMPIVNGKKVSKKTGKAVGRPTADYPATWIVNYTSWKSGDITATEAMKRMDMKRTTFYKLVSKYESVAAD